MSRIQNVLKSLSAKPGYTLMRCAARFGAVRQLVAGSRTALHGQRLRRYLADCEARMAETVFPELDRASFVERLRQDGIAFGLRLSQATVDAILAYAEQHACYADREPAHGFMPAQRSQAETRLGKPILLAQYFNSARDCPAIAALQRDPALQWIAGSYLQSVPTFVGANLWWTYPVQALEADRDRHAHLFHRDVDDFRFFKFFFYLTEVVKGDGAHVCVVASHRHPPQVRRGDRWNIRRYSDAEIAQFFPAEKIVEICGEPGVGFAENTLCVHKGRTPNSTARLLLQLQFALFDWGVMHDQRTTAELKTIT